MYTIVLVIKRNTHNNNEEYDNIDRFINIGMKSYKKYLNLNDIAEFIIVTPNDELEYISNKIENIYPKNEWKWNFISEDKLIDNRIPSGWGKQQTIKIAISPIIKTKEYLIIDDDTFLTKSFSYNDMFVNNKLIMNKVDIDFPFFFLWSSQILEVDYDIVQYYKYHMGITPQIFVTNIVKDLLKFLIDKYGNDRKWQIFIVNNKFTEYTLYWIWLIKNNIVNQYYIDNSNIELYGNAVTVYNDNIINIIENIFKNNHNYYFSFIQSSLDYKNNDLINKFINLQ